MKPIFLVLILARVFIPRFDWIEPHDWIQLAGQISDSMCPVSNFGVFVLALPISRTTEKNYRKSVSKNQQSTIPYRFQNKGIVQLDVNDKEEQANANDVDKSFSLAHVYVPW